MKSNMTELFLIGSILQIISWIFFSGANDQDWKML